MAAFCVLPGGLLAVHPQHQQPDRQASEHRERARRGGQPVRQCDRVAGWPGGREPAEYGRCSRPRSLPGRSARSPTATPAGGRASRPGRRHKEPAHQSPETRRLSRPRHRLPAGQPVMRRPPEQPRIAVCEAGLGPVNACWTEAVSVGVRTFGWRCAVRPQAGAGAGRGHHNRADMQNGARLPVRRHEERRRWKETSGWRPSRRRLTVSDTSGTHRRRWKGAWTLTCPVPPLTYTLPGTGKAPSCFARTTCSGHRR